jgi:uncharacterized protein
MRKIAVILAVFCGIQLATAFTVPSTPSGYVNDYANVLSATTKSQLENELQLFAASTTNEIAVVTVPDLGGDTIEHYATKLFESWKIGNAKHDNGILLLVAVNDHKLRIEVGYGLEGDLPDILAKNIIDTVITPSFKSGDYDTGIVKGVTAIMQATFGEYKANTTPVNHSFSFGSIESILIFVFVFLQFLSSILARSKSWWAGGVLGGIIGGSITVLGLFGITFIVGAGITVVLVLLGLLFDYIVSSTYTSSIARGGAIPWWIGGGGRGGFGGGGSSFGGFSGGSSGGGGASGSW